MPRVLGAVAPAFDRRLNGASRPMTLAALLALAYLGLWTMFVGAVRGSDR